MKTIISSGVVAAIIAFLILGLGTFGLKDSGPLGAATGPDVWSYFNVHGVFQQGGGIVSIATTSATYAITGAQIADENVIDFTPLGAAATVTLPASSTFPGIQDPGDYRQFVFRNAATAATTTTFASSTGTSVQRPDGQNFVIGQSNFAWITCYRMVDTSITCLVDESTP